MTEVIVKRGYAKWTDENGVRHKVPLDEYNAMAELKGDPTIEGESAPARGPIEEPLEDVPAELEPEVPEEDEDEFPDSGQTVVERDAEVAERAFTRDR